MQLVQAVLEGHDAKADRAVAHVRVTRLVHGVVVDVDDVVEHAHGGIDRLFQLVLVQLLAAVAIVLDMAGQIDRAQVADSGFRVTGIERDLGAQVGRVHHAGVLLGRAHVAGILEGNPGMAGFEQHRQHLAPQVDGRQGLGECNFSGSRLGFVGGVGLLERCTEQVMQIRHIGWREQGPAALFHHALHEQVGNPVGRVHVMGAAAVVAGVLAQLQEFFDVQVPGFQVRADRALALAALVHGHGRVIDHLEERHHALRFAIGALDAGAQGAHARPVVAQAAGKLGQQCVLADGVIDAAQVVGYRGQVAGGQLRALRAAVEQRRRGRHEVERRQQFIELDGARITVFLVQR
ncbi:hypothetical protein D3C72_943090 [compost metagenome]